VGGVYRIIAADFILVSKGFLGEFIGQSGRYPCSEFTCSAIRFIRCSECAHQPCRSNRVFFLANLVMQWIWVYLQWLAHWRWWGIDHIVITPWQCALATLAALCILAPRALPGRLLGWLVVFSLLFTQ